MVKKKINKNIKVIAFDLDGTLIDSAPDLASTLNEVLTFYKIKTINPNLVRNYVGRGAKNLIELSLKKNNQKTKVSIEEMVNKFLLVYKKNCTKKTKLFPNVVSVLKELKKNFQLILVSNKPEYFVKKILKYFNIFDLFNAVSGGDTFEFKKPDPKHLLLTLNTTGCNIADCVLVGDSMTDVECAKNAKIPIILTSFGYNNEGYKNLSIDYLINNLNEIPIILKYLSK